MKKILIVVDMQNDFITGPLGTKEARAIVSNVVEKVNLYLKQKNKVLFTKDTHADDYLDTQEGKHLPVKHCISGDGGWEICPELQPAANGSMHYVKNTFGSKWLVRDLENMYGKNKIDEIELVGVCTDICVISTALLIKAFLPEVKIIVDASCCAGVTPESHKNALQAMKVCQINVIGK